MQKIHGEIRRVDAEIFAAVHRQVWSRTLIFWGSGGCCLLSGFIKLLTNCDAYVFIFEVINCILSCSLAHYIAYVLKLLSQSKSGAKAKDDLAAATHAVQVGSQTMAMLLLLVYASCMWLP